MSRRNSDGLDCCAAASAACRLRLAFTARLGGSRDAGRRLLENQQSLSIRLLLARQKVQSLPLADPEKAGIAASEAAISPEAAIPDAAGVQLLKAQHHGRVLVGHGGAVQHPALLLLLLAVLLVLQGQLRRVEQGVG